MKQKHWVYAESAIGKEFQERMYAPFLSLGTAEKGRKKLLDSLAILLPGKTYSEDQHLDFLIFDLQSMLVHTMLEHKTEDSFWKWFDENIVPL